MKTKIIFGMLAAALIALTAVFAPIFGQMKEDFERVSMALECRMPECLMLELEDQYLTGTDGACVAAGMLILRQFALHPGLKQVYLTNRGWVPSAYRLIDERWARCLADEDPRQECEELANPGWYDRDP